MKAVKKLLTGIFLIATTVTLLSFDLPKDWFKAGSHPKSYDMGIDKGAGINGTDVSTIKSNVETIDGFGTLMRNNLPDEFLGKRVRMSSMLKTQNVSNWAGLWFRIDQKDSEETLGFDNMHDGEKDRSIKGTTDWTEYEIVLDVPLNATKLAYGVLLVGTGQVWFDNIKFEVVDKSVPTTNIDMESLMEDN